MALKALKPYQYGFTVANFLTKKPSDYEGTHYKYLSLHGIIVKKTYFDWYTNIHSIILYYIYRFLSAVALEDSKS